MYKGLSIFQKFICNVTYHKSYIYIYILRIVSMLGVNGVRMRIMYILIVIIIFLHRWFNDILCVMLSFQIL